MDTKSRTVGDIILDAHISLSVCLRLFHWMIMPTDHIDQMQTLLKRQQ